MEFPDSKETRLTEKIMQAIGPYLKPALAGHPHPYNRTYEAIHRILSEAAK